MSEPEAQSAHELVEVGGGGSTAKVVERVLFTCALNFIGWLLLLAIKSKSKRTLEKLASTIASFQGSWGMLLL